MKAELLCKKIITGKDTLYVFRCPEIAASAKPGQFVEVKLSDAFFLRRPISIFDSDGAETLSLLVRTVGRATEYMLTLEEGMQVDILGPLGNGFAIGGSAQNCLLAGGGIGLAPLYYLARCLKQQGKNVRLFFSPKRDAELLQAIDTEAFPVTVAENRKDIADQFPGLLESADIVYSCGPEGLLEYVAAETVQKGVPCQLSMERRMGCGIDLCKGCVVAVRTEQGLEYKLACHDGPVFEAKEVAFHENP